MIAEQHKPFLFFSFACVMVGWGTQLMLLSLRGHETHCFAWRNLITSHFSCSASH
jgi:hypothetical protein